MSEESTTAETGGQGLDVQLAHELVQRARQEGVQRARQEGVSLVGPDGLLAGVTRTVLQTALDAEMTEHLGYAKGDATESTGGNYRNGTSPKTVYTEVGPVPLDIPRDRQGCFEPQIVPKHSRRVEGFDDAIISLYAKGLTTGEIQAHLAEIYSTDVSKDLISRVTDQVIDELNTWQQRPLDRGQFLTIVASPDREDSRWRIARGTRCCRGPSVATSS